MGSLPNPDNQSYDKVFFHVKDSSTGCVPGGQAAVIFEHSGLPETMCSEVWDLAYGAHGAPTPGTMSRADFRCVVQAMVLMVDQC